GFALAAAQAAFDGIGDGTNVVALHNKRFVSQQVEAGRPGLAQISTGHQLAAVETAGRVDTALVILEGLQFFVGQVFVFGQSNTVFARDNAVQFAGNLHD